MADFDPGPFRLIGREHELEALDAFIGESTTQGSTLLLTGEPGVGKTALLRATAAMAEARGVRVIRGGGVEYETEVSFAGLHQLIDPLGDDLRRLPPSGRTTIEVALGTGSGPPQNRLSVMSAVLTLFRQAASEAPLLIAVDDLQWLDRATGAVLGFVGRRIHGSRIGLLGAARPGVGFFERAGLSEFDVLPLHEADALELLTRHFAHLPTRVLRGVVDEAQGNPLALLEFAGSADGGDHEPQLRAGSSREVQTLFQTRVERLPAATRRLLLLTVLEGSGSLRILAEAASGTRGLDVLAPAERDHLIVVDDRHGEVRFRHPMIRSAVVECSTLDQRRAAHQRLAEVLANQPERRGQHLAEAAFAPDQDVAAAVETGAYSTLQRGDVVGAISRLMRAADLSPTPAERSRRLADAAFIGAHSAGQLDSSTEMLRDARRKDPTLGETLHAAVATSYLLLNTDGEAETAHQLLTVAVESALDEPRQDHDGLSEALYTLVLLCHYAGRDDFWVPFHDAIRRLDAAAPPDALLLAEAFADPLTVSPWALNELDLGIERLGETMEVDLIIRTAIAGFYTDRLSNCRAALSRVVEDGREGGAVGSAMMALSMSAYDDLNAGRWDAAHAAALEATTLWEERGYRLYAWSGHYAMALVTGNRGDRAVCRAHCDAMMDWAAPRQMGRLNDWAHHALAQAALGAGEFEDSYAHATAVSPPESWRPTTRRPSGAPSISSTPPSTRDATRRPGPTPR